MRDFATRSRWSALDKIVAFTILAIMLLWSALPLIGRIEGRYFPVVTNTELFDPKPFPPPEHRNVWEVTSIKLRDCVPIRNERGRFVTWYFGPRNGRRVDVIAFFDVPPQRRDKGVLYWERLVIALDDVEVMQNSHADVLHHCPIFRFAGMTIYRPWYTQTAFYTGEQDEPI